VSLERVSVLEEELTAANQEVRAGTAVMSNIMNVGIYLSLLRIVLYPQSGCMDTGNRITQNNTK